jgi:hypothetical protein
MLTRSVSPPAVTTPATICPTSAGKGCGALEVQRSAVKLIASCRVPTTHHSACVFLPCSTRGASLSDVSDTSVCRCCGDATHIDITDNVFSQVCMSVAAWPCTFQSVSANLRNPSPVQLANMNNGVIGIKYREVACPAGTLSGSGPTTGRSSPTDQSNGGSTDQGNGGDQSQATRGSGGGQVADWKAGVQKWKDWTSSQSSNANHDWLSSAAK